MMPPIKQRSPTCRWAAAEAAHSAETLGVLIDNGIQSSMNVAAAAAADAGEDDPLAAPHGKFLFRLSFLCNARNAPNKVRCGAAF